MEHDVLYSRGTHGATEGQNRRYISDLIIPLGATILSFGLGFYAVVGIKKSKKNIEIKTINLAQLLLFSLVYYFFSKIILNLIYDPSPLTLLT